MWRSAGALSGVLWSLALASGGVAAGVTTPSSDDNVLLQVRLDVEEADASFHDILDQYNAELGSLSSHLRIAARVFNARRRQEQPAHADKLAALLLEVRTARSQLENTLRAVESCQSDGPLAFLQSAGNPWPDIVGEPSEPEDQRQGGANSTGGRKKKASDPNDLTDPWPSLGEPAEDHQADQAEPVAKKEDAWSATPEPSGTGSTPVIKTSKSKAANPWLILMLLVLFLIVLASMVVIVSPMSVQEDDGSGKRKPLGKAEVRVRSRFAQVVLPFWTPAAPDSCGLGFMTLLLSIIFTAASLCFWASFVALSIGRSAVPFLVGPDAGKLGHGVMGSLALRVITIFGIGFAPLMGFLRWKDVRSRTPQWCLLGLVIFVILIRNAWHVASSFVQRLFMDAMMFSDADIFWKCYWVQCCGLVFNVVTLMFKLYLQNILGMRWREYVTHHFLDLYMARRSYYELDSYAASGERIDNPDQRMQEDARTISVMLLEFALNLLDAFVGLISFATVLWNMKPMLTIVAVCYSIVGSFVGLLIAWKLIVINYINQRREADFRFSLVHVRNNPEAIAFYGGEQREKKINISRFDAVLAAIYRRIVWDTVCQGYTSFYMTLATILPPMLLFQAYFKGDLDFGAISQAATAFGQTMTSLSFVITNVHLISDLATAGNRLGSMLVLLRRPDEPSELNIVNTGEVQLQIKNLSASVPGEELCIVRDLNFCPSGGREPTRLLLVGASGVGKSSLLRVVAGLWRAGKGEVVRPANADCLFLPQKPYMPLGDLRTQLIYPDEPEAIPDLAETDPKKLPRVASLKHVSDADLRKHLASVGLGGLPDRFEEGFGGVCDWSRVLSGGEQQRLATVRIFVRNPKLIILDEATSALSPPDESRLYQRLVDDGLSFLSVGHRDSLIRYHDKVIELQGGGDWKLYNGKEFAELQAKKNR